MKKTNIVQEWAYAWKELWSKGWYLPSSAALDIVFLVLYGFMTAPVFGALTEHIIAIGTFLSGQMSAAAGRARPAVIDALFQPPVSKYTWQFIGLLLVLGAVIFCLYWIFQGLAWFIAGKAAGSKESWRHYLLHFARINALWLGIYFAWHCLDTLFALRRLVIEKAAGIPAPEAGIALWFVLAVAAYFAVLSYPVLSIKKAFSSGTRNILVFLPVFAISALQLFIGNFAMRELAKASPKFAFIIGAIILFVLFAFTRLYISIVVRKSNA
jgi:hypothetical protein